MGVKQLWTLLAPVGRPVPLETLEGKILAIDSSIWLYQFQATMRDKEGRALVNAHILGFLRRISKLLFYGIKPVFVFDGGAPVLKRNTIAERKKRKSGAAASHAKLAEKLLAAQLRREALRHTEEHGNSKKGGASPSKGKRTSRAFDDDTNFLEDLSGPSIVLPGKHNAPVSPPKPASKSSSPSKAGPSKPSSKSFREHDPYQLPELTSSIDARTLPNDPRLATDEELRAYISHLRPDDPEFHELPAEAQYEILGELRLKSRTTSHRRLQKMLRQSKTPMDFSMAQIKNLGQRNKLTQEVLSTLNIVGTGAGGVVVPVKIASEKNREYVLIRNETGERGFTLGIRQEGNTAEKPIVVEEEEEGDDSFDSKVGDVWEDIVVPGRSEIGIAPDQDWRDFKRENALAGLAKRDTDKRLAPLTTKSKQLRPPSVAARPDKGKGKQINQSPAPDGDSHSSDEDPELQLAVHASLSGNQAQEDEEDDLQRALALSLVERSQNSPRAGSSKSNDLEMGGVLPSDFSFGPSTSLFGATNGLLGGNDSPASSPPQVVDGVEDDEEDLDMEEVVVDVPPIVDEGHDALEWEDVDETEVPVPPLAVPSSTPLKDPAHKLQTTSRSNASPIEPTSRRSSATRRELAQALTSSGDEDDEETVELPSRLMTILAPYQTAGGAGTAGSPTKKLEVASPIKFASPKSDPPATASGPAESSIKKPMDSRTANSKRVAWNDAPPTTKASKFDHTTVSPPPEITSSDSTSKVTARTPVVALDASDEDMDEVVTQDATEKLERIPSTSQTGDETTANAPTLPSWFNSAPTIGVSAPPKRDILAELTQDVETPADTSVELITHDNDPLSEWTAPQKNEHIPTNDDSGEFAPVQLSDEDEDDVPVPWSRSPTPSGARSPVAVPVHTAPDFDSAQSRTSRLQAEEEEHATFMSQLQGKSYATMRESLDAEIAALRKERAAALRDAEDVTTQMSAQIQVLLRLFGVPFVNAPMEAEAQCAFLAQHGLVEGVITDDSDVFLFGAGRVFRNMFNQSKTVECFLAADLERELGLERETLIGLAYLLGSDYTEGLPGVGPVVAMEIMKEFPGETGLREFSSWWRKVQVGKDADVDLKTTFRKRFKKKFTSLHLTEEWPNPKVREAYLNPAVDQSEERFQWGLPDLDGLRRYLAAELSWTTEKVDETILPIIRRMTQRSNTSAANRQGTLTSFFDAPIATSSSSVTHAPRKRQPYASKRLQQVVAEYRARKAGEGQANEDEDHEETSDSSTSKAKRKRPAKGKPSAKGKDQQPGETESQDSAAGTKRKRKNPGKSARGGRGGRGGRGRGASRGRGKGRAQTSDAGEAEETEELVSDAASEHSKGGVEPEAPAPKKPRLRPRMKVPSPAPQSPIGSESDGESSDEYVES